MSYTNKIIIRVLLLACCIFLLVIPAHAFTANSLDIIVKKDGDAVATFRFTLEGFIENSIPQSLLEEELIKGLTTSSEPPELKSMDRSSAVLLLKKFADISDVPTGTEYRTASMDFKKAEIALQNSALSSAVSADFSPEKIVLTFPDSYQREFSNIDLLPAVFHTVIDPSKTPQTQASPAAPVPATTVTTGSMNITSSPLNVKVYLDSGYIGEAPSVFPDITSGTHRVEFRKEGYEPASKNVTINAGKSTNIMVVLKYIPPVTTENTSSVPGFVWIVLIIALTAIGGGAYYFWSEKKKREWSEEDDNEAGDNGDQHLSGRKDTAPIRNVLNNSGIRSPVIKDTVAKGTILKDTIVKDSEIIDTVVNESAVKDTIVKVTILKDIPDKETNDKDTKETSE